MLGMTLKHMPTGLVGAVTAQSVQPDGMAIVRVSDKWLPAAEFGAV